MNDWNELENRLRSWNPRRPSAKLEQRLFGARAGEREKSRRPEVQPAGRGLLGGAARVAGDGRAVAIALRPMLASLQAANWLAPAMVLFVLAAVLVNQGAPGFIPARILVSLDHPQLAAYYESQRHSGHNAWREASFEWTNRSRSLSTAGSLWDVWATNQTLR